MEKKKRSLDIEKIHIIILVVVAFFAMGMVYMSTKDPAEKNGKFLHQNVMEWKKWTMNGQKVVLPVNKSELLKQHGTVTYLTNGKYVVVNNNTYIMFYSLHTEVAVRQLLSDGTVKVLYHYGKTTSPIFRNSPRSWNVVKLQKDPAGSQIEITAKGYLKKYNGRISKVYCGDKASLLLYLLDDAKVGMILSFVLLSLGCFMLIIWFFGRKLFGNDCMIYLAIFSFIVFIWSFTETSIRQFFVESQQLLSVLPFECLMIGPLAAGMYCVERKGKVFGTFEKILFTLFEINFWLQNILQLTGIFDFAQMVIFTHVMILLAVALVITTIYSHGRFSTVERNVDWISIFGSICFCVMALIDILRYYILCYGDNGIFTRVGLIMFILSLGIDSVKDGLHKTALAQKAEVYKKLAFYDALTDVYNRMAYERKLDELENNQVKTFIMMIDVNELKYYNDTFGHEAGDEYLKTNIAFLKKHFDDIGDFFRIGGDEFVCLVPYGMKKKFMECMDHLEEEQEKDNDVNFAFGYAVYEGEEEEKIRDTALLADQKMYEKKKKMKQMEKEKKENKTEKN